MQTLNEINEEQAKQALDALDQGIPLYQSLNIDKQTLEAGYLSAYNSYVAGNYQDAETMFSTLALYNSHEGRYFMGLGSARQAREKYLEAIDSYAMAALISEMLDPTPQYYAAICMIKLGKLKEAIATLEVALKSSKIAEFEHIKQLSEDLLETLKAG